MTFDLFYIQIICVGLLILAALYTSRLSRRLGLGEVVGQVLGGLLVGPVLLLFIGPLFPSYGEALQSLHFFTFVFLSLIAFGIGDEFYIGNLRRSGKTIMILTLIQGCITWVLVTAVFFLLGFKPIVALVIGSIGIATAPASSFAIMNRLNIGGNMRQLFGGIVVFDDLLEVLIFSVMCQAAILAQGDASLNFQKLFLPVGRDLAFSLLIGFAVFLLIRLGVERRWLRPAGKKYPAGNVPGPEFLSRLISELPGPSVNVFLIVAGCLSLGVGLALHWHLPFLITAVSAGILISNLYSREIFQSLSIQSANSIFTLIFFALIGANADLSAFHPENLLYIGAYILTRGVGKVAGTWLGCIATGQEKEIRKVLPKLMLPQAGVAAVEAFYVAAVLGDDGKFIVGIIIPGLIVFELLGVLISERSLLKWRAHISGMDEVVDEEALIRKNITKRRLTLGSLLHPECLHVPLDVSEEGEAIWQLIRSLESSGMIENPGKVLEIIMQRERQGGISLGDGVAIPHGRLEGLEKPAVAIGILPEDRSIACGGSSDELAEIIFLVVSPAEPPELHLEALAAIANFLQKKDARVLLRHARDHREAMEIIRKYS